MKGNSWALAALVVIMGMSSCDLFNQLFSTGAGTPNATIRVTGVTVAPTSANIMVGGTVQLNATVAPSNATYPRVTWVSDHTAIASVSGSGLVTGVAAGSAGIWVTTDDGQKTASSAVTVNQPTVLVTALTIHVGSTTGPITNNDTSSVSWNAQGALGVQAQLSTSASPSNASNSAVVWTSSDTTNVVTVSTTGLVTVHHNLTTPTIITATAADGSGVTATCTVTTTVG